MKLNFGSYAHIIYEYGKLRDIDSPNLKLTIHNFVGLLLVAAYDEKKKSLITNSVKKTVRSKYYNSGKSIAKNIKDDYDRDETYKNVCAHFENNIVSEIDKGCLDKVLAEIFELIQGDESIERKDFLLGLINEEETDEEKKKTGIIEFLSRTFIYAVQQENDNKKLIDNASPKSTDIQKINTENMSIHHKQSFACNLPCKNDYFVGRKEALTDLFDKFNDPISPIHIQRITAGLGGIGKSQLAREYAHRNLKQYKDAVGWINAQSTVESCSVVLDQLGFSTDDLEPSQIIKTFVQWCNNHDSWLLVLDNVERWEEIEPFVTGAVKGHIIITSRDNVKFSQNFRPVRIGYFNLSDVNDYIIKRETDEGNGFSFEEEEKSIKKLAERLGYLPLAIVQAVS